jgi:hypothetical protein
VASITVVAVVGCAGGVTQQSSLPVAGIASLGHARHVVTSRGNCLPSPAGTGMLRDGDFSLAPEHGDFATEAWIFQATSDATRIVFQSDDQPITSNCGPVVAAVALAEN